jgi:hypothetical protein
VRVFVHKGYAVPSENVGPTNSQIDIQFPIPYTLYLHYRRHHRLPYINAEVRGRGGRKQGIEWRVK